MRGEAFRKQRRSSWTAEAREQEYWLSYSDLMAGLLMVFALILMVALYDYQSSVGNIRDIAAVRQELIQELQLRFGDEGLVSVEPATGVIRFNDAILFAEGSAALSAAGKQKLALFAADYLGILLGNPRYREQLDRIIIEGHTNDVGSYMYNLQLSQARAYSVMAHLITHSGPYGTDFRRFVTANGRSEVDLIRRGDGSVDRKASRRIEIRFRLKDRELLHDLLERIFPEPTA